LKGWEGRGRESKKEKHEGTHVDVSIAERDQRLKGSSESSRGCSSFHTVGEVGEVESGCSEKMSTVDGEGGSKRKK